MKVKLVSNAIIDRQTAKTRILGGKDVVASDCVCGKNNVNDYSGISVYYNSKSRINIRIWGL